MQKRVPMHRYYVFFSCIISIQFDRYRIIKQLFLASEIDQIPLGNIVHIQIRSLFFRSVCLDFIVLSGFKIFFFASPNIIIMQYFRAYFLTPCHCIFQFHWIVPFRCLCVRRIFCLRLHLFDSIYLYYDENQRKGKRHAGQWYRTQSSLPNELTIFRVAQYIHCALMHYWAMNFNFQLQTFQANLFFEASTLYMALAVSCLLNRNDILLLSDTNKKTTTALKQLFPN